MTALACRLSLVLLLAVGAVAAQGDRLAAERERLEAVRAEIESLEQALVERHGRVEGLEAELAELEASVSEADRALHDTERAVEAARARLASLRAERAVERERLAGQREHLAGQLRAVWQAGESPFLRLLLSQEQPDRLQRLSVYYRHFARARAARIEDAVAALERLDSLQQEIDAELERLESLRAERQRRHAELEQRLAERRSLLERLRDRLDDDDRRLARLRSDEERLGELVSDLRERLERRRLSEAEAPGGGAGGGGWPVAGELLASYGSTRSGDLRWSGVLIGAEAGTPVRAVAGGRVVFADWLRGVGLLLIIDHGGGQLSLYGHNQALYRDAGDRVGAGEVIATVGSSGGQRREGLYFEVRVNGDPVDPLAWLERRGGQG
ncbi:MAG: peptidoglycan DD-metalloendopeptidase family protein [Arhodomonas sp.]|nr:peptidoglycan DD-metalloendopeptidase family protein [Arhodomonas sp.]